MKNAKCAVKVSSSGPRGCSLLDDIGVALVCSLRFEHVEVSVGRTSEESANLRPN